MVHTCDKKESRNLTDMIKLIQERGEDIPECVARDLSKLPPITFDSLDESMLLSQIQKTQAEVNVLKATVASQNSVADSLKEVASDLQVRVSRIEHREETT